MSAADGPDEGGVTRDEGIPGLLVAVLGVGHQAGDRRVIAHRSRLLSVRAWGVSAQDAANRSAAASRAAARTRAVCRGLSSYTSVSPACSGSAGPDPGVHSQGARSVTIPGRGESPQLSAAGPRGGETTHIAALAMVQGHAGPRPAPMQGHASDARGPT